jgi:hypothetical protein
VEAKVRQLKVRNIPAAVEARLRRLADESGASINQTVVRLLEAETGLAPAAPSKRDLAAFAGRWTAEDADAFDAAMRIFEALDEEVWR